MNEGKKRRTRERKKECRTKIDDGRWEARAKEEDGDGMGGRRGEKGTRRVGRQLVVSGQWAVAVGEAVGKRPMVYGTCVEREAAQRGPAVQQCSGAADGTWS